MRLFKKRQQQEDAALIDRDRGKAKRNAQTRRSKPTASSKRRQTKPKDRYESPFRPSPHEHETIPMIDRIPTAMGYHSDGSEEEWLEEKSKCSRYETPDDEQELREEIVLSDEEDQGDDKYSVGRHSQNDGIQRLWSDDSFDSKPREQTWDQFEEKQRIESYYKPGDVSYLEDSKNDPIYDSPKNSPCRREAIAVAPDVKEASVAAELEPEPQKEAVKKVNDPHEIDTSAAPKRDDRVVPQSKPEPSTIARDEQPAIDLKLDTEASKELDAIMSKESAADDPLDTLAATDVLVKEIEAKLKTLKATAAKEKKALKKIQRENRKRGSRGRSVEKKAKVPPEKVERRTRSKSAKSTSTDDPGMAPEIAKSVLNGFTVMLFRKKDGKKGVVKEKQAPPRPECNPEPPLLEANINRETKKPKPEHNSKPRMLEAKLNRQTKENPVVGSGEKVQAKLESSKSARDDETSGSKSKNKSGLWNLRLRNVFAEKPKSELNDVHHPISPTLSDPPEHDEYSVEDILTASSPQAPALVQCLKFYSCTGVAENVGKAMRAADRYRDASLALCGSPTYSDEPLPVTPKPTVEIVLEEIDRPDIVVDEHQNSEKRSRLGFFANNKSAASPSDLICDHTPEAPVLVSSKGQPKVLNVTGMTLHLDGDSDHNKRKLPKSEKQDAQDSMSHASSCRVSVTSIKVPNKTKSTDEANETKSTDDEPRNRRRLPRFLKKFSLKKQA